MKNIIPLIIAVVLGCAAVFAVMRMIKSGNGDADRQYVDVVAAARDITPKDDEIKDSWLMRRRVEVSALPAKAILWSQANRVVRQRSVRMIAKGDYILTSDISGVEIRLSGVIAEGEWAVPVTFSDAALVRFLQPGDEIAILGAYSVKEEKKKMDQSEKPDVIENQATSVIFPCVRIVDIGKGDGVRRDEEGNGTVIVAMPPQQIAALVAAQREMELYPALRRQNDPSAMRRRDVGLVNDATFRELKNGLEPVKLPDAEAAAK